MSASVIAQLIIALGPTALQLIQDLIRVWDKPTLTVDEVMAIVVKASKSYDEYIAEAKAKLTVVPAPVVTPPAPVVEPPADPPPQPS